MTSLAVPVTVRDALVRSHRHVTLAAGCAGLALGVAAPERWLIAGAAAGLGLSLLGAGRLAVSVCLVLVLGGLAGDVRVHSLEAPARALHAGDHVRATASLVEHPRPGRFGPSAEIRLDSGPARGARLLARFARAAEVPGSIGARVRLDGVFSVPRRSPGADFDFPGYLRREGMAGELNVARVRPLAAGRGGVTGVVDTARTRSERLLGSELDEPSAALVRGMVLGQDEAIDAATTQDFRDSGLGHVLAVSGQNIMLLAVLASAVFAATGLPSRARWAVTIGLIVFYVPLAGAGPSLQRAGVMGVAALLALALSRPASRWYTLLLACAATLALNPRVAADPGWQLSFAAVAGILLLAPGIASALKALPRALAEGIAVTVAASVATAPLVAHHFGTLPLAGIPANLVALPLVAPIMWLGMIDVVLAQLAALGGPVAGAADAAITALAILLGPLTHALSRTAAAFADLPGARVPFPVGSRAAVPIAYSLIALAALGVSRAWGRTDTGRETLAARWRRAPRRSKAAIAGAGALMLALLLARTVAGPGPPNRLTVSFLDVGQGDATLIQDGHGTDVLFDGGPPEGQVVRKLRRAGVRRLAVVVMTHQSRDHHGGLIDVVRRFPVGTLLDGGDGTRDPTFLQVVAEAQARGARRVPIVAPLALQAGALRIRFLSPSRRPPGPPPDDPNPRAAVAIVSDGDFDLFLSADAEPPALLGLDLPDVDAMKLPHHGSSDPGLPELLRRLRPEAASIPVGLHNDYGHPAPSTLTALRRARIPTWRNDLNGTVRMTVEDGHVQVRPDRGGPIPAGP